MLTNPRRGQLCRIHYAASYAGQMPHHGKNGRLVLVNPARKLRNHLVRLADGKRVSVPAGNLFSVEPTC